MADINVKNIVRIVELRGSNKCEVEYSNGTRMLSLIPTKYKKNVWIRKGDFAVTEEQADSQVSSQVRTSISQFLSAADVKDLKKQGLWPAEFTKEEKKEEPKQKLPKVKKAKAEGEEEEESEGDDDDLFVNPNHQVYPESDEEEEDEEEDDE
eukprot:Phypoly_transcript_22407.p2 GENE.Phypoly_transcript_22407~~Phypoly_transcript_22407.p2  ORF type:complete len:152 (+),score=49.02 Phypoly_transcript_22407:157-612(+)